MTWSLNLLNTESESWLVWLSWLERFPTKRKVTGSIPGQGTHLGCGLGPQSGHTWEATNVSLPFFVPLFVPSLLSFSLPSPLSKNKTIKSLKKNTESDMWKSPINIVFLFQEGKTRNGKAEYLQNVISKMI